MSDERKSKIETRCPCCQTRLTVDALTGLVIWHDAGKTDRSHPTMEEMIRNLDSRKKEVEEKINQESRALKDRSRILDEMFKESMRRIDKDDPSRPVRPIDLD
jgi:hypothetical protein